MTRAALVLLAACGSGAGPSRPAAVAAAPDHVNVTLDARPTSRYRHVPPEAFLRAYLTWFGGLVPADVVRRAHGYNLFDQWTDYLAALGLPDYHVDAPRADQSNAVMLAAIGRLGEALCVRSLEHDTHVALDQRLIFAFDIQPHPSLDQFASGFDVLHRTFLGYPAPLAPSDRTGRFFALYQQVVANHSLEKGGLTPDQRGWAAVCTALIQHPEAELY